MGCRLPSLAVIAAFGVALSAQGATVSVGSEYGEAVDQAPVTVSVWGSAYLLDCTIPARVQRTGDGYEVTVHRRLNPPPGFPCANNNVVASLGMLPVGTYRLVVVELERTAGEVGRQTRVFDVLPVEGRCASFPGLAPQIVVQHRTLAPDDFVRRLNDDAAYAAMLGNPVPQRLDPAPPGDRSVWLFYPPLDDPTARHFKLAQTGEFAGIGRNGYTFGVPPGDASGLFVEFYNSRLDHYFYTSDQSEIAAIESGVVGPGWLRTGETFNSYIALGQPYGRSQRTAYRFTGTPDIGPSTHVFTVNREECYSLSQNGLWLFEGIPLAASPVAADGTCAVNGEVPLYRMWKPFGVSNHRFTTRQSIVDAMGSQGWVNEGPAMCVLRALP